MKTTAPALLLVLMLGLVSCASKSATSNAEEPGGDAGGKPVETYDEVTTGTEFNDIIIPTEMTRVVDESNFFETKQFKMGILVYEGRSIDSNSLSDAMVNNMVKRRWTIQSTLKSIKSVLVFDKANKSCVIQISEGALYTRMVITAVELKSGSSSQASEPLPASGPVGKPKSGELKPAFKNEKNLN